jgi:hypothetical protein
MRPTNVSRAMTVVLVATLFLLQSCCAPRAMAAPKADSHCPIKKASECPAAKRNCTPQPPQTSIEPTPAPVSTPKQVVTMSAPAAPALTRRMARTRAALDPFAIRSPQLRI